MIKILNSSPKTKTFATCHIGTNTKATSHQTKRPNMTTPQPLPPSWMYELNRPTVTIPDEHLNGGTTTTTCQQQYYQHHVEHYQHHVVKPNKHTRNARLSRFCDIPTARVVGPCFHHRRRIPTTNATDIVSQDLNTAEQTTLAGNVFI